MSQPDNTALGLTGLPFDDVKAVLRHFPDCNAAIAADARARMADLAADDVPLGRLASLGPWLAGWKGNRQPRLERIELAIYAALAAPHDDAEAQENARNRLTLLAAGGHPANIMCLRHGVGLKVYDLALDVPHSDYRSAPALSEEDCAATMAFGMEAIVSEPDLLCLARFGAGGEAAATALAAVLHPELAEDLLAGLAVADRVHARTGMNQHQGQSDPFELMRRFGSRDMAAIVGSILAARTQGVPVVLDGFVPLVAAAVLHAASDSNIAHCLLATPGSVAQQRLAAALGLVPLVQDEAVGEGVGALLAVPLLRAAADVLAHSVTQADVAAAG
ncbi:nicotinate-nucleotide--dimethylbenzimidazole phosphoribosyltransferase [Govanella unica]|uniref:Nicotinate-nucleotide--dimethylbenzimidazole phosphoribosyltransferase n=1 Tax=Govanella unica TaxID=2975056 RepID=A0A9X3TXM4_9PROT|nr:nicotinate-nucleotide--dimethylbenzimidazole phosphoribosyltransferase [Govania unica]MDA5193570.1 nicotinate-nucleotide--dimethylbenzimidazole phosphoribosyltransferase [Govania unica]